MTPPFDPWEADQVRRRACDRYHDTPAEIAKRCADAEAAATWAPPDPDFNPRRTR